MAQELVERLRKRPKEERHAIAVVAAVLVTIVLLGSWVALFLSGMTREANLRAVRNAAESQSNPLQEVADTLDAYRPLPEMPAAAAQPVFPQIAPPSPSPFVEEGSTIAPAEGTEGL